MLTRLSLVVAAMATPPSAAQVAPPVKPTMQQAFDAATALADAGKHAEALAAWEAIEKRSQSNARTLAIVRVRKAGALLRLGRREEAAGAARVGVDAMPQVDASLREDRTNGRLILGSVASTSLDYAGALAHYRAAAETAGSPAERYSALIGQVEVGTFVDPEAIVPIATELQQFLGSVKLDPAIRADALDAMSRLYLNLGRFEEARKLSVQAVSARGGLTLRASALDASARANAALAYLMLGNKDEARRYLAYTGAGRSKVAFPTSPVEPPSCGTDTGIRPDDVAVVEFSIEADGAVTYSVPIYASRRGDDVALQFARAARNWSWSAENLKDLPEYFRTRVRLELRCSTAFSRPSIADYLRGELTSWLETRGAPLGGQDGADAVRLRDDRRALAAVEVGGERLQLLPILFRLADNPVTGAEESERLALRALAISQRENAPPLARLAIERILWNQANVRQQYNVKYRAILTEAMRAGGYGSDPAARAAIALLLVDSTPARQRDLARPLLSGVGDDAALPTNHPMKVGALVRLASLEQSAKDQAAARVAFEKSGLSAEQCALLDAPPQMLKINAGFTAFPQEALAWGFEGWARIQYDIDSEGRSVAPRAIAAYPPFVFSESGAKAFATARFTKSYRPGGALGCGGNTTNIRFSLG